MIGWFHALLLPWLRHSMQRTIKTRSAFPLEWRTRHSKNIHCTQALSLFLSIQENYEIMQHKTLEQRCAAAQILQSHKPSAVVLVDTILNSANIAYGAFPQRLYIIRQNNVVYQGGLGPSYYNLEEVRLWLEKYRQQITSDKTCLL
jgi:hypothetical protein